MCVVLHLRGLEEQVNHSDLHLHDPPLHLHPLPIHLRDLAVCLRGKPPFAAPKNSKSLFENNIVYINHKVTTPNDKDGKRIIVAKDKGKSSSSTRALPIDNDTKERLKLCKEQQEFRQKKYKRAYSKKWLNYVMVDELGELILPNTITDSFNYTLEKHGLRHVRFHDLRHTCATLLLSHGKKTGVGMKDIQVWLGHSDYRTTANIYSHVDAGSKQTSLETIAGIVHI